MDKQEIQEIAAELILLHNDQYEFSLVYEDERADKWTEDEQAQIFDAMIEATITVTFKED
jgi:hypothetical protein